MRKQNDKWKTQENRDCRCGSALRGGTVCSCTDLCFVHRPKRKGDIYRNVCVGGTGSDDCLYVAVGEPTSEKKRPVVIYRQNDEKNVREGFGKIKDNKLVVAVAELTIEGTGEQVTIHYDGENYPGKKIDDVPNIVNNGKAAATFDKHYK